jgi:hypothetical protein
VREDTQEVVVVEVYQDVGTGVVVVVIEAERYVCPLPASASYYPQCALLFAAHGCPHWLVKTKNQCRSHLKQDLQQALLED